jgi:hypothetical protein
MASKTQIRLQQLTGSLDDSGAKVHPSAITDKSLQGVLDALAASVKRIHGGADFSNQDAGTFQTDLVVKGTTPQITIGDAGAEDAALIFDGNAVDFHIGLDDSADKLSIGLGSTLGTTPNMTLNSADRDVAFGGKVLIPDAGNIGSASDPDAIAISSAGVISLSATTEASAIGTAALVVAGGASVAKDLYVGDDLNVKSNAAAVTIGDDQPFTLTHSNANNTLLASANHRLAFGNAADYISGDGTDIDIVSSGDLDINATLVDVTGALTVSGLTTATGRVIVDDATDATSKTDGSLQTDGGLSVAKKAYIGTGLTVEAGGAHLTAGRLTIDDATEATSTTDGSLQTDGGLSVAKSAVIGDDLDLLSDGAILSVGAGKDFTITHDGGTGATITAAAGKVDLIAGAASSLKTTSGHLTVQGGGSLIMSGTAVDMDSAGVLALDGLGGVNVGVATSGVAVSIGHATSEVTVNDNLTVTGDLTVNGATVTIDTTNLSVKDPIITLGEGAQVLNSNAGILFTSGSSVAARPGVAFGRVANDTWGIGSIAVPSSGTMTTVAGMTMDVGIRAEEFEIGGSTNVIEIESSNLSIVAAADVVIDPAGGELRVDGNVVPNSDSADSLGASGIAWANLFVDAIDLNGQGSVSMGGTGRIDLDADDDTSIRASADDVITFEVGGADAYSMDATGFKAVDNKRVTLGSNDDFSMEYDELVTDTVVLSGSSAIRMLGNNREFQFGASTRAISASGNNLVIKGTSVDVLGADLSPLNDDGGTLGSANQNWSDLYLADAAVLNMGDDQDVTLTHVHDAGVLLGGTRYLSFSDANSFISNPGAGLKLTDHAVIEVEAATSIQMDSPIIDFEDDGVILQFGDGDDVTLTHVHNSGLLLNGAMKLQFGDANTTIAQVADSVLHYRADGQHLFDGGGGLDMHLSGSGGRIGIPDNTAAAFGFQEGSTTYMTFVTTNSSEAVKIDKVLDLNDHLDMQGSLDVIVSDSAATALEIKNASGATYFNVNTAQNGVGVPDGIGLTVGSVGDFSISHNGTNTNISNATGILEMKSAGGNLILSASAANSEIEFGDAYSGNKLSNGMLQLADSVQEYTDYVSNFASDRSLIGALNSLASGGTRGKFQVAVTGSHAANIPLLVNASLNHDQGVAGPAALDVFVNGQLLTSGTAISDGDYKIGITSNDHIQFFFALENGDQLTVVKP